MFFLNRIKSLAFIAVFSLVFVPVLLAGSFDKINEHVQKGIVLADGGNCDQAIIEFNKGISICWDMDYRGIKQDVLMTYIYYMRGHCLQTLKRFEQAADDYLRVLYFSPQKGLDEKMAREVDALAGKAVKGLESLPGQIAEKRRDIFAEKVKQFKEKSGPSSGTKRKKPDNAKPGNVKPDNIKPDKKENPPTQEDQWDF